MKFIRNYKTREEFENDYYDEGGVEVVSITCDLGTFEYFGEGIPLCVWKNGDVKIFTERRIVEAGDTAKERDYDGDGIPFYEDEDEQGNVGLHEVTAVDGDTITCDLGTFTYDGIEIAKYTSFPMVLYVWKKDNVVLITRTRTPIAEDECQNPEDETTHTITSVEEVEHESKYFEPWVSISPAVPGVIADGMKFDYYRDMEQGIPT
jgi:hypothetical protein